MPLQDKGYQIKRKNFKRIKSIRQTKKLRERKMKRIFTIGQEIEKYIEAQKGLYALFIDIAKAYDQVPRKEVEPGFAK